VSSNATTTAAATKAGLRVDFAPGQSELSPSSAAAIKELVQSTPSGGMVSYDVAGHAAGTPEDPSTARRLSLARALAVRSALVSDGVPSTRIFVRALGSQEAGKTPDRVEVTVQGENAAATPGTGSHQ
jgi:outer membrane protein OmpA-like peptidoglycan-associated protein